MSLDTASISVGICEMMEAQCQRRLNVQNSYSLQKLEEILRWKETEMAFLKSEIDFSRKKLSRFKNFETGSSSQYMDGGNSRLTSEGSENFAIDNQHHKKDAIMEKKGGSYQCKQVVRMPSDEEWISDSRASGSNKLLEMSLANCSRGKFYSNSHKVLLRAGEVEWINEKLQILEEETETMKQALLGGIEERREMINEIYQQFQIVQDHLQNDKTVEEPYDGALIVPCKDGRRMETGLSQVLCQDSNPSFVTRDLRANMLAFQ